MVTVWRLSEAPFIPPKKKEPVHFGFKEKGKIVEKWSYVVHIVMPITVAL